MGNFNLNGTTRPFYQDLCWLDINSKILGGFGLKGLKVSSNVIVIHMMIRNCHYNAHAVAVFERLFASEASGPQKAN